MQIVCVGDCGVDHYLPSGEQFAGGITANFARHARATFAADDTIGVISCIGEDAGAELVSAGLGAFEIDAHLRSLPGRTPVQYIEIKPGGEKNFVRYDEGVLRDWTLGPAEHRLIGDADLLVAPVYLQIVDLFDSLLTVPCKGKTCIDFADFLQHPNFDLLDRHIDRIDIGFFGLSIDDRDTIAAVAARAAAHDKLFVVTLGAEGSVAFSGSKALECDAVPVEQVVDTTGAGDAFAAAFLAKYCRGNSVDAALAAGAGLAAKVIGRRGTVPD